MYCIYFILGPRSISPERQPETAKVICVHSAPNYFVNFEGKRLTATTKKSKSSAEAVMMIWIPDGLMAECSVQSVFTLHSKQKPF